MGIFSITHFWGLHTILPILSPKGFIRLAEGFNPAQGWEPY